MDALRNTYNGLRQQLDAENAELKRELASRPVIEPNIAEQVASKDQRIRELEQLLESYLKEYEVVRGHVERSDREKDEAKRQLTEATSKIAELEEQVEELQGEFASNPVIDPNVVEELALKDERIRELEQQFLRSTEQFLALDVNYCAIRQSQQSSDREKEQLQQQLADATAKIAGLEKQVEELQGEIASRSMIESTAAEQLTSKDQRILELEQQLQRSTERYETMDGNNDTICESLLSHLERSNREKQQLEQQLTEAFAKILELEEKVDEQREAASQTQATSPLADCQICLSEMGPLTEQAQCTTCRAQWHTECINEWAATNPTCPMCRSRLPNPPAQPSNEATRTSPV